MAASAQPINSSDIILEISEDNGVSYDRIGRANSGSLSTSMDVRDITTKDSDGWRELGSGLRSWSLSGDGLVTYSTETDVVKPNDLYDLIANRTKVKVRFGNANAGDYRYHGDAYLTSYEQEAGTEDNTAFSFQFEGTGELTQEVIV